VSLISFAKMYRLLQTTSGLFPVKAFTHGIQALATHSHQPGVEICPKTEQQLHNLTQMHFIHSHVAAMPDAHFGKGATVGSVIPSKSAIIPAAVGVDIGCGMCAVRTSLRAQDLPDSLRKLRLSIEAAVPVGTLRTVTLLSACYMSRF
jgi:RNA-splicing ligase RtcB